MSTYIKTNWQNEVTPINQDNLNKIEDGIENAHSELDTHLADYVRQPGYGATGGSANAYTLTLNPAPTSYVDGMGIVVKIHAANTGASTINVNSLGAKSIVDSKGNALTSGKLRLNGTYSLKYNTTTGNFILQGEGGEYGTATADKVLTGYTIGTESGLVSGTMSNNGAVIITPTESDQIIPAGYHNGSGKVSAIPSSYKKYATGTITPSSGIDNTVTGLAFTPKYIIIEVHGASNYYGVATYFNGNAVSGDVRIKSVGTNSFVINSPYNIQHDWIAIE